MVIISMFFTTSIVMMFSSWEHLVETVMQVRISIFAMSIVCEYLRLRFGERPATVSLDKCNYSISLVLRLCLAWDYCSSQVCFKALIWLVGLGVITLVCCWGNGAYARIVVYNKLTNRIRALKSTSEYEHRVIIWCKALGPQRYDVIVHS